MKWLQTLGITSLLVLLASVPARSDDDQRLRQAGQQLGRGQFSSARSTLESLRAQYRNEGDLEGAGVAGILLALGHAGGDSVELRRVLQESVEDLEQAGDGMAIWLAHWILAQALVPAGDLDRALEALDAGAGALARMRSGELRFKLGGFFRFATAMAGEQPQLAMLDDPALLPMLEPVIRPMMLSLAGTLISTTRGGVLIDLGRLDKAEVTLNRARQASPQVMGMLDTPIETRFGQLRVRQGRLDEARQHYKRALEAAEALGDRAGLAGGMGAGGLPMPDLGAFTGSSLAPLLDASRIEPLVGLAEVEALRGDFDAARRWQRQAVILAENSGNRPQSAMLRKELAVLDVIEGRFEDADRVLDRAMADAQEPAHRLLRLQLMLYRGALRIAEVDYEGAVSALEPALHEAGALNRPVDEAAATMLLGTVYHLLGDEEARSRLHSRALKLATQSSFASVGLLVTLLDHQITGSGAVEARGWVAEAERRGDRRLKAQALVLGGLVLSPEDGLTLEWLRTGRALAQELGWLEGVGLADLAAGRRAAQGGDRGRAEELWAMAEQTFVAGGHREMQVMAATLRGYYAFQAGRVDDAFRHLRRAADGVEEVQSVLRVPSFLIGLLDGYRVAPAQLLAWVLAQTGAVEESWAVAEQVRARALSRLGLSLSRPLTETREGRAVAFARQRVRSLEESMWGVKSKSIDAMSVELMVAREAYRRALDQLPALSAQDRAAGEQIPTLAEVRRALPADAALIEYLVSEQGILAWVLTPESVHVYVLPGDKASLDLEVRCLVSEVSHSATGPNGSFIRSSLPLGSRHCTDVGQDVRSATLFQGLVAPLLPSLDGVEHLHIVPHGPLHRVPLGALRDAKGIRLIERADLTLHANARTFVDSMVPRYSTASQGALVLGAPTTSPPPLSGMAPEARQVAEDLGTQALLACRATKGAVNEKAPKSKILHLAVHAVADLQNPRASYVALAAGDGASCEGGADGDGRLHPFEIAGLDLRAVELVVLSACSGSLGRRTEGDEIDSLSRAFLEAGAGAVVASLWPVDDLATAQLMGSFYRYLKADRSVAEALQKAQLDLQAQDDFSDPYFWASFQVTGQGQLHLTDRGGIESR